MSATRKIALIAHDGKKDEMVAFARQYRPYLLQNSLIATNTTGQLLKAECDLVVEQMLSGPLGGDAQIAARVAIGEVAAVLFFMDPLGKHPHDPDIQSLLRICNVHNIPLATNPASAAFIISAKQL